MNLIKIGTIVNTHGIRGEIKVYSDIDFKEELLSVGKKVYITDKYIPYKIENYRVHKGLDMLRFEGVNNINDIIQHKGSDIYIDRDNLKSDVIIRSDMIGMNVYYNGKHYGFITDVLISKAHDILKIKGDKTFLVPNVEHYVDKISLKDNKIYLKSIEVLLNED